MANNSTFLKVSNKDIYDQIQELKRLNQDQQKFISDGFVSVIQRQDKTNGKVKLSQWVGTTALTVTIALVTKLIIIK